MENKAQFQHVAVIGAGAWGTALADLCARNGLRVTIWARETEVARAINDTHENTVYLAGIRLDPRLRAVNAVGDVADAEAVIWALPVQYSRDAFKVFSPHLGAATVALCSKGIETDTGKLLPQVLAEVWPEARCAMLSGPSFAADVANGLPTAVTLASQNKADLDAWVAAVGAPHFRPYVSDDVTGAALGGAVKNVLAIAAGVVAGRKLGESARAALVARGFREFVRLGEAMGARDETMSGLSGLGDLILTAATPQSRNMSLGAALGEGLTLDEIMQERRSVSEGVATAPAVVGLAKRYGVETPICAAVAALLAGEASVDEIIERLLSRPFTTET